LTFTAAYDADGSMVTQKLPGQVTQTSGYDEAGEPVSLTYSGTVQPVKQSVDANGDPIEDANGPVYEANGAALADQPWLAWSVTNDAQGRVKSELTGPSAGFDGNPGVNDPHDISGYDVSDAAIGYDRFYSYDAAGRLATVADHTASAHGADLDASPCIVRAYAFDDNGRRMTLTSTTRGDGDCAGTTGVTTAAASFNYYDSADRPTLGQGGTGQYGYDALGRQTTVPGVDAPNPAGGDITLGYFDDDLPRSVAQGGTSTVFTLDSAGRRSTATTTTGTTTSTLVRHYADGSDNPAWTDKDGTITRYAESVGGDLGLTLAADGSGELTLANLHGDVVTTVPIGATAASGDVALGVDGWSDFTEYGAPRAGSTTATTGGSVGYGWLGAKQRSTTSETAGLTLMGDRLYNAVTARFTSLDPEPGGSAWAYGYPTDPINQFDLDGHWWSWARRGWHVARAVRNAPFSLVGYGYARVSGARCRRTYGLTMACTGGRRFARYGGMTIGNVWVTRDRWQDTNENLRRHERRHSSQWAVWGGNFPSHYAAASLVSAAIYKVHRRKNCSNRWACYNAFEMHANLKWGRYVR
jgi:RHS repeat-associated protein